MESEIQSEAENDSNVSCFKLDGVVAEMVIDIDDDNDLTPKSFKEEKVSKSNEESSTNSKEFSDNVSSSLLVESEKDTSLQSETSENLKNQIVEIDELPNDPKSSMVKLATSNEKVPTDSHRSSVKEDEVKKSLISELNQIRKAARLIGESKDEIVKVAHLIKKNKGDSDVSQPNKVELVVKSSDKKKSKMNEDTEIEVKRKRTKSKLSAGTESLKNVMPTALSTRSNKRKLVDIENDFEGKNSPSQQSLEKGIKRKLVDTAKDFETKKSSSQHSTKKGEKPELTVLKRPKVYNMFAKDSRLRNFSHLRRSWDKVHPKFQRHLYRVIFDKWAPIDGNKVKAEILDFRGFSFSKDSEEEEKRKHILKKLPDLSIEKICFLLDLPIGLKDEMISSIFKFLYKPTKTVLSAIDPFQSSMQPVVIVERLSFDNKYLSEAEKNVRKILPVQEKNTSYSDSEESLSANNDLSVKRPVGRPKKNPKLQSDVSVTSEQSLTVSPSFPKSNKKSSFSTTAAQNKAPVSILKPTGSIVKSTSSPKSLILDKTRAEDSAAKSKTTLPSAKQISSKVIKANVKKQTAFEAAIQQRNEQVKLKKLKNEIKKMKADAVESLLQSSSKTEKGAILPSFGKKKNENESDFFASAHQDAANEEDSSEVTLSAEEAAQETKKAALKKKKKTKRIRCGKPLRSFFNVRESIQGGNFSALQRLHILLFGASDKPENLKANILAFGGFPFLERSDEWKQKEFLLSLLSLTTLKEYLTLLCIEHSDDDQQTLINKLMKFLAAPGALNEAAGSEPTDETDNSSDLEVTISDSELLQPSDQSSLKITSVKSVVKKDAKPSCQSQWPAQPSVKISNVKSMAKKEVKKKEKKKETKPHRNRKVLMSEDEVRRLEADIAREQRIREREKKLNEQMVLQKKMNEKRKDNQLNKAVLQQVNAQGVTYIPYVVEKTPIGTPAFKLSKTGVPTTPSPAIVKQADAEQLNALLQTVYKRRALKNSGAIISTPNKGMKTKLGDLPNVKFLVVTANYGDLDVLHHLIYMTDAVKSKVRKNILDFSGFGFNEDSPLYKDRILFLNSLGYDISKRVAFLLGLCPYKVNIANEDLNELIMYFLMSPCKTKQVPITHLPQTFFSKNMPEELCLLMQKHGDLEISSIIETTPDKNTLIDSNVSLQENSEIEDSAGVTYFNESIASTSSGPRAKKGFKSSGLSPPKTPSLTPSIPTIPLATPKPLQRPDKKERRVAFDHSPASALQKAILQTGSLTEPITSPQEYLVQQQTPDGRQKTYKLIKLPANHPLTSVIKPQLQVPNTFSNDSPPVTLNTPPIKQSPVSFNSPLATLPPGVIIFKDGQNNPPLAIAPASPTVFHNVPVVLDRKGVNILSQPIATTVLPTPKEVKEPEPKTGNTYSRVNSATTIKDSFTKTSSSTETSQISKSPIKKSSTPKSITETQISSDEDEDIDEPEPVKSNPPTNDEIFSSIQEIIHNSDPEQVTLRNVIDHVTAQYSDHDLKSRHIFMKECVKKVILGGS